MEQPDLTVSNEGSIFLFVPLTQAGLDWLEENVASEPWQWFGSYKCIGSALSVDHRYARDLVQGAIEAGLVVV